MNSLLSGYAMILVLSLGADPKPTNRDAAESKDANLARYKLGGFAANATGTLGIEVKYPENVPQGITINSFKVDSTAKAAGLEANEWILEVDGGPVGLIRGRYYEPWTKYGRAGLVTEAELLVSFLNSSGERRYYYPKVKLAGIAGDVKAIYKSLPDDFFTVKKPRKIDEAEGRDNNFSRYKLGAGNFEKYAGYELGAMVAYSYEAGATIRSLKSGGSAEKAGLKVGDMILEVDGAPVGQFGDRLYEVWRQYAYSKEGEVELLVAFVDPGSNQLKYYYPKIKLQKKTSGN